MSKGVIEYVKEFAKINNLTNIKLTCYDNVKNFYTKMGFKIKNTSNFYDSDEDSDDESSKTRYARIYGYGVVSILFFHIAVNVGMTIGIAPVIGIPLPFFSYGGSSLFSFTILLFIALNFYANRTNIFASQS